MTSTGSGAGITLQSLTSVQSTVSKPVEQTSSQVRDGRQVEDGDTGQAGSDGRGETNQPRTDAILNTQT